MSLMQGHWEHDQIQIQSWKDGRQKRDLPHQDNMAKPEASGQKIAPETAKQKNKVSFTEEKNTENDPQRFGGSLST